MATVMAGSSKGSVSGYQGYLTQEEKTEIILIETKDCTIDFARDFVITKNLFNKTEGVQFHEIIQSFAPGEVSDKEAHEIGKEMLKNEKFKDFQAVCITHKDKNHIHNHIIINSVSFENGIKYQQKPFELKKIKELSNELCKERDLSYLNLEQRAEKYINQKERKILKEGKTSKKEELREWIKEARKESETLEELKDYLKINFNVETKIQNKNIKFKHPQIENFMNGKKLGADYQKEELENGIFRGQSKQIERRTIENRADRTENITRNDNEINGANTIPTNEYIGSGIDEGGEYETKANFRQLHDQIREVRGLDKQFDPEEQRRIREENEQTERRNREKLESAEREVRELEQRNREKLESAKRESEREVRESEQRDREKLESAKRETREEIERLANKQRIAKQKSIDDDFGL